MRFGSWQYIGDSQKTGFYKVRCKCGVEKDVAKSNLISGGSKQCRKCYYDSKIVHGHAKKNKSSRKRIGIYGTWEGIKGRCLNTLHTAYKSYGARGITICDRWLEYKNFFEDMGDGYREGLEIDRIDNNKGYFKENCRWVTHKQNTRNRRNCRFITYNGETKTIAEWSEFLGFYPQTLTRRIELWGVNKAFETPIKNTSNK